MGYYIEVPENLGKAAQIRQLHGGQILNSKPAWQEIPEGKALIVVVNNGLFEAAAYAYDEGEYRVFTDPRDYRPKQYVLVDRQLADTLTHRV